MPEGLRVVQTGRNPHHHEIVPAAPMPLDEYQELLKQIVLVPVQRGTGGAIMVLTAPTFTFHFPADFDARAEFEMPCRGYLTGGHVETAQGLFPVTFYDPVRLAQDVEAAGQSGAAVVCEPGLVVIPEVTRDGIAAAVEELVRQRFFDHLRPVSDVAPGADRGMMAETGVRT